MIVSHRSTSIEVWTRQGAEWSHAAAGEGQHAAIEPIRCTLDVDRIYRAAAEPAS